MGWGGIFKTFIYHFLIKKSALLLLKSPLPPPRRSSCWKDFDDGDDDGDGDDGDDERFCWSTPRFDDDAIKIRFAKVVFVVVSSWNIIIIIIIGNGSKRRRSHHPMRFERDRKSFVEHHDERS